MNELQKVSVIILNFNGKQYLDKCLKSLRDQSFSNFEVIMVDNASTDDSVRYTEKNYPWVKIVKNHSNQGYAKANNNASRQASGEYILFLNMDTWVKANLLEALVSAVSSDSSIGACACMQLSYDGKYILNLGMTIDLIGYPIISNAGEPILYSDGASLFIRKSVFNQIGGFDADYFMYAEDVDLCWRVWLAGYKVEAVPLAVVYHKSAGTFVLPGKSYAMNTQRRYLAERNSLRSLLKNYSVLSLGFILPVRFMVTLPKMFMFIFTKPELIMADFEALNWNLRKLGETLILRGFVQTHRCISDRKIMSQMSKALGIVRSFSTIRQGSLGMIWNKERKR